MDKKNDIIEEQRRAREEFLKLKKMQKGELQPEAKPSEVAVVPKTFKEKFANFWYHYKIQSILAVFLIVFMAVGITQCVNREEYDLEIMYFTYTPAIDTQITKIEEYFEEYAEDINGDGKVMVQVKNCSVKDDNRDPSRETMFMKVQSIISQEYSVVLYIVDQKAINYFEDALGYSIFVEEPTPLGFDFYRETAVMDAKLPEDLKIGLRILENTGFEGQEGAEAAFKMGEKVIAKIKKQNG